MNMNSVAPSVSSTPNVPRSNPGAGPVVVRDGSAVIDEIGADSYGSLKGLDLLGSAEGRAAMGAHFSRVREAIRQENGIAPVLRDASTGASDDPVVEGVYQAVTGVNEYLKATLGRDGWDGKGTPLNVIMNAVNPVKGTNEGGAMFRAEPDGTARVRIGRGADDDAQKHPHAAADILAHEVAHGVWDTVVTKGQHKSGEHENPVTRAMNESWGDVFALGFDKSDWKVGGARDAMDPALDDARSVPATYPTQEEAIQALITGKSIPGFKGDHNPRPYEWSSVPTLVAARTMQAISDRDDVVKIWYDALQRLPSSEPNLDDLAHATREAARSRYGPTSRQAAALEREWAAVRQGEAPAAVAGAGLLGKITSWFT